VRTLATKGEWMRRVLLALVAGVLLLGACGDDDGGSALDGGGDDLSADEQELVDELKSSLVEEDSGLTLTDAEADCAAVGVLRAVGAERARELSDAPDGEDNLTEDEAEKAATAMVACTDLRPIFVSSFTEGGEISEESATCLADAITDDDIKAILVTGFTGAEDVSVLTDLTRKITGAMSECLTDEEFADMAG
jgi:hypothetical protein